MSKQTDWGVVSHLEVHADTFTSLKAACEIALTEHSSASGWQVLREATGEDSLQILWHVDKAGNNFLSPITDAEELAQHIWKWLQVEDRYVFSEEYDTDGDLKKGYKVTNQNVHGWSYEMFKVIPEYIVYGK